MANLSGMTPAEKLRAALELYQVAEDIQRQNLRRRHPEESEEQIEQRLGAWLRDRPGAELGDGPQPDPLSSRKVR